MAYSVMPMVYSLNKRPISAKLGKPKKMVKVEKETQQGQELENLDDTANKNRFGNHNEDSANDDNIDERINTEGDDNLNYIENNPIEDSGGSGEYVPKGRPGVDYDYEDEDIDDDDDSDYSYTKNQEMVKKAEAEREKLQNELDRLDKSINEMKEDQLTHSRRSNTQDITNRQIVTQNKDRKNSEGLSESYGPLLIPPVAHQIKAPAKKDSHCESNESHQYEIPEVKQNQQKLKQNLLNNVSDNQAARQCQVTEDESHSPKPYDREQERVERINRKKIADKRRKDKNVVIAGWFHELEEKKK